MAAVAPPLERREAFAADREGSFMRGLATWPELNDLLSGSKRVGPVRVMTNWHGYFREAAGAGWALLGDAGHFKDPSPAQGIADAFIHAERLADAVAAGLGGAGDIDRELHRWWRWRDEDAYEMHWFSTDMGEAGTRPVLAMQALRDIAADDEATQDLLRVLNHDLRPRKFFGPRRIARAAVRAARARPGQIPAMMKEAGSALRRELRRSRQRRKAVASLR